MPDIDLISVHVPKCAGSSLLTSLERAFGSDAVYRDYSDGPGNPSSPMNLDPDGFFERMERSDFAFLAQKKVIHGHFHIRKYRTLKSPLRVTFLRDPVDRMISHYFYFQAHSRRGHPLQDYVLDNKIDIEGFARLPFIRRYYESTFFSRTDMKEFDLIGFHDCLMDDYKKLSALVNLPIDVEVKNANITPKYQTHRESILSNSALMRKLRDILKDDIIFYDRLR